MKVVDLDGDEASDKHFVVLSVFMDLCEKDPLKSHASCHVAVRLIWGSYVGPGPPDSKHSSVHCGWMLGSEGAMNFMKIRRRATHLPSFLLSSGRDAVGET